MSMPDRPPGPHRAATQLECSVEFTGHKGAWVTLDGELDIASVSDVAECLLAAMTQSRLVVVDISRVSFIDSTGLKALIDADLRTREHDCRLLLMHPSAQVQRLLEVSGASEALHIARLDQVSIDGD